MVAGRQHGSPGAAGDGRGIQDEHGQYEPDAERAVFGLQLCHALRECGPESGQYGSEIRRGWDEEASRREGSRCEISEIAASGRH